MKQIFKYLLINTAYIKKNIAESLQKAIVWRMVGGKSQEFFKLFPWNTNKIDT